MSGIHTETVGHAHDYTRSRSPWILGACGSRLIHYISGGGMNTFGRLVGQEEARRRHRRFLVWTAVIGVLWLGFYIF